MLNPEDDIENIYRDFANNYPLKANEADWEEFEQKLDYAVKHPAEPAQSTGALHRPVINMYRFWVAAVIILAAFTGIYLYVTQKNEQPRVTSRGTEILKDSVGNNVVINNANDSTVKPRGSLNQALPQPNGTGIGLTTKTGSKDKGAARKLNTTPGRGVGIQNSPSKEPLAIARMDKKNNEVSSSKEGDLIVKSKKNAGNDIVTNDTGKLILNTTGGNVQTAHDDSAVNISSPGHPDLANHLQNNFPGNSVSSIEARESPSIAIIKEEKGTGDKKKSVVKIKTLPHKYFYLGLVTGPDINTVKLQRIDCAGLSSGVIAGIQLSARVRLETGLYYEVKKYYSSGQYVNKQKLGYNDPDDVLKSVDANSRFFEIPVIIGVNFASKNKHNFFFSAGFSSYFTGNENYELLYHRPSGPGRMEDRESREWDNSFFSAIPLSVGYQFRLSTHNILRIEPYAKLPLYGIGKISLPVISSGIYINITHAFFK